MASSSVSFGTSLTPFPIPTLLPNILTAANILPILFGIALVFWLISSVVMLYHWLRYHRSFVLIPALAIYGVVSLALILYAASGIAG